MINLNNRDNLELFVNDNIAEYNIDSRRFSCKRLKEEISDQLGIVEDPLITATDIEEYLKSKFYSMLENENARNELDEVLGSLQGNKTQIDEGIIEIANERVISKNDLKEYYASLILDRVSFSYRQGGNHDDLLERLLTYRHNMNQVVCVTDDQARYVKLELKKTMDKAMYLVLNSGFTKRRVSINEGVKIANEGDSAQFLFLARAILAGFNCSNVDVRSSGYDAVIDYNSHLLRVQVKGISGESISLKNRTRGGAGIDSSNRRNQGQFISSEDADIYVAVDKQFGICYIIPMTFIDENVSAGKKSIGLSSLEDFKENWDMIAFVEGHLFN